MRGMPRIGFGAWGSTPVYPELAAAAKEVLKRYPDAEFRHWAVGSVRVRAVSASGRGCKPGSVQERAAMEIQRAEWQLLFDYSARPQ